MSTGIYAQMLSAVSDVVVVLDHSYDVHTITLVLNGQHGEFDLTVEATDDDLEDYQWKGIAYRHGGVDDLKQTIKAGEVLP